MPNVLMTVYAGAAETEDTFVRGDAGEYGFCP
jgi:hypothetical protein